MKLDIIERSKQTLIATYSVPELSMLSFREWKDSLRIVIPLTKLPNVVTKLNSTDPETGDPASVATSVDFYLPDPLKNKVFSRLAKDQTDTVENPDQFTDRLNEVSEQVSTPSLKSSTILSAVMVEISQNHRPHEDYEVRISDE
ncbi:hypothetical protein IH992_35075 [Candidatus Poribacteria bacterium]|nr:hypothetical protein [Candidatus Poribacteria bacterium]